MFEDCKSPFAITDKTFEDVSDLIQNEYLIGGDYDEYETEPEIKEMEIICSDKTMIATPEYEYDEEYYYLTGWTLSEK